MLSENTAHQAATSSPAGKVSGRRSADYDGGMDTPVSQPDYSSRKAPSSSSSSSVTPPSPSPSPQASPSASASNRTSSSSVTPPSPSPSPSTSELSVRPPATEVDRRASERDQAVNAKPVLARVLQVLLAVLFPLLVTVAAIRAVTTPAFLWLEYHRPGFPADRFGFSTEDRMTYGSYTMDYLLNFAPLRYLADAATADGEKLFAPGEAAHMADVKTVIQLTFLSAAVLFVVAVLIAVYLRRRYPGGVRRGLFAGAVATLVLMAGTAVLALLGWQQFFAGFHAIFFADGTWTFAADDTLIRLFPAQFWMDSAIAIAAIVLLAALLTLILTWPTARRRAAAAAGHRTAR